MPKPRVSISATCGIEHVQQILSGFLLLSRRGEIELKTRLISKAKSRYPFLVYATINGVKVIYDLQDGILTPDTAENDQIFRDTDVIFARGYVEGSYGRWESKVSPLGLNYYVTVLHPLSVRARISLPAKDFVRDTVALVIGRRSSAGVSTFEIEPGATETQDGPIVFFTRVWDLPYEILDAPTREVEEINDARAETVRTLRQAFGARFLGGVSPSDYALQRYPDVVTGRQNVGQRAYLAAVRRAAVCVTTRGLGGSNGWKLAEYVAGSRAIVVERPEQAVPGPFADGTNYLAFDTQEDLVNAVAQLLSDQKSRTEMAKANWDYYRNYVRPDALVQNTVALVTGR